MTITIDLSEDTAATLNARARAEGRPAAELVVEVVTERFGAEHDAGDFPLNDDALEKIRRGFEDMDTGRTVSLEASRSRIESLSAARHGNGSA